ncbi:MAG: YidC/Oxa1 family membrane protein insertase [Nitrospirota bacterium]
MNFLYQIFISPIEAVMHLGLSITYSAIGDYGLSILLLSLLLNLVLLPLFHIAEKWQEAERRVQNRLKPKLQEFKKAFSGEERHTMIHTLYRQAGYHPIYAMRGSVGFLLQLPFWIAAYQLLSHYQPLQGVSFLLIEDLGNPDKLLWGINLLPFVMTVVNLLAAFVYTQKLGVIDKIQPLIISLFFLALLYNSPAGLLLYWTFNSIFSLVRIIVYARLNPLQKKKVGRVGSSVSTVPKHLTTMSGSATMSHQIQRETINFGQKILQSPYVLALLVGLFPFLFYYSNNWYINETYKSLFIIGIFSGIIWAVLSLFHVMLSWFGRKFFNRNATKIVLRLFVLGSILVMAFLLRETLSKMMANEVYPFLIVGLLACVLAWFSPKIQIWRFNMVFMVLCLWIAGNGLYSVASTEIDTFEINQSEDKREQAIYNQVKISQKSNVYYIVPDGYPNREALNKIYGINNTAFYSQLESLGFTIHPSAFSNYSHSMGSIGATFGMGHHYYRGKIGFNELLYGRDFIVSEQNPVVHIFKNNGYQVHFVHESEYMLRRGCFVDSCSPRFFLGKYLDVLIPKPVINSFAGLGRARGSQFGFKEIVLRHIDTIAADHRPHFTYIHATRPGHGWFWHPTPEKWASWRKGYFKAIQYANDEVTNFVQHILTRDPNALIIINGDHGAWGLGSYGGPIDEEILKDVPNDLIALDHLGVLLAIRWPDGASRYDRDFRTNVNLFRFIFSYLSESEDILATKVSEHGYLTRGEGKGSIVVEVVHDGEVLEHFVEVDSGK